MKQFLRQNWFKLKDIFSNNRTIAGAVIIAAGLLLSAVIVIVFSRETYEECVARYFGEVRERYLAKYPSQSNEIDIKPQIDWNNPKEVTGLVETLAGLPAETRKSEATTELWLASKQVINTCK